MNPSWQLQEAKNRFSEVVEEALTHGPQTVTRHGREVVVVLAMEEYRRMQKPKNTLHEFLLSIHMHGKDDSEPLDLTRSRDMPREIDL